MKILFLTRAYGEYAGGMERLSFELIQHVAQEPNVQVEVLAHKGPRSTSPFFNLSALPKALSAAKTADVIHLGDPMLSFLGWAVKLFTRKPVIVTIHGLDITFPNFFYQMYLEMFFQNFDRYLTISQHVNKLLHTKFHIASDKSQVINPGISDRFYDPKISREDLSKLLSQDVSNKKVLFTSGRLVKRKGHEWFIRNVLPKLPENFIYVIAGDGPERENITKAVSGSGRVNSGDLGRGTGINNVKNSHEQWSQNSTRPETSNVILLGKVSDSDLKILYNTVDAFVMPNVPIENDVEGFGLVLLEAALCNRPVFASNLEGITDAIQTGKNGTLLPAQNSEAWVKTLQHISPLPSREYTLKHFGWEKTAKNYLEAISAVHK